jgi:hypothetical protein
MKRHRFPPVELVLPITIIVEAHQPDAPPRKGAYGISVSQQKCSDCGKVKAFSEFSPNPMRKTGLWDYCKDCHRLRSNNARHH